MKQKMAWIFPGQGAQYVGMGKPLYEAFPQAKAIFDQADAILDRSLTEILFQGPESLLTHTRNSQTAIYVMSAALMAVVRDQFPHLSPTVCAGLSLGEYTAAYAAGALSFEEGLRLVQSRGEFMNQACEQNPGVMAVVMGLEAEKVEATLNELALHEDLWAANFNCPGQVVISGTPQGVEKGKEALLKAGAKRVLPLSVHGAFHSGLMLPAQNKLAKEVEKVSLKPLQAEWVMNVPGDFVTDPSEMKKNLIQQVTYPVRWEQGVRKMEESGVELYVEMGPGTSLGGINKRIKVTGQTVSIEKPEDLERLKDWNATQAC